MSQRDPDPSAIDTSANPATHPGTKKGFSAGLHLGKSFKLVLTRPQEPDYLSGACSASQDPVGGEMRSARNVVHRTNHEKRLRHSEPHPLRVSGREARDFLARELMTAASSAVQTVRVDLHGRYVVHLFIALHCNECEAKETRVSGAARTSTSRRPDSAHSASNVQSEQAPASTIS